MKIRTADSPVQLVHSRSGAAYGGKFLFCQFQLVLYQFKVISPLTDQRGVRALLNDLSPAQDNDVVGMTYGREAVSNHDTRAVVELLLQCLCDAPFVLGIKRGRGLVEQEVLRIPVDVDMTFLNSALRACAYSSRI